MRRFEWAPVRGLLSLMIVLAIGSSVLAGPPPGKGGGGGGEDPPAVDPPFTYQIFWVNDFQAHASNNQGDLLGASGDITGSDGDAIHYGGVTYLIDPFFAGTGASLRFTFSMSDRASDGAVCLCGSADAADGVRGWVMKLTPNQSGALERTSFTLIAPITGDNTTAAYSVNSAGEAAAISTLLNNQSIYTSVYHSPAEGDFEIGSGDLAPTITEFGEWYGRLFNPDGSSSVYKWTIDSGAEHLIDELQVVDTNNLGNMIGTITTWTKRGSTTTNYFFDGTLTPLSERQSNVDGPFVKGLNDFDDFVTDVVKQQSGNKPSEYSINISFSDLGAEFSVFDILDPSNSQIDIDLFNSIPKSTIGLSNSGIIVGTDTSWLTYVLVPVQP